MKEIDNIKKMMEELSISQIELSAKCGIAYATINKVLNGKYPLSHKLLVKFAEGLNTTVAEVTATRSTPTATNNSESTTTATQASIHTPVVKLRKPTPFSGKASECTTFFNQLRLAFIAEPAIYHENDGNKILLAINCMTGNAFRYNEPYLEQVDDPEDEKPEILKNFNAFVDLITEAFGDTNPVMNAEAALRSLKQTGAVSLYATEFRRIIKNLKWNDDAYMSQFKVNLKEHIKRELHRRKPEPTELNKLITECISIDNMFSAFGDRTKNSTSHQQGNRNRNVPQQR